MNFLKHMQVVMESGDLNTNWSDWPMCCEIRTTIHELRHKDRLTKQQDILIMAQQGCERHSKINNRIDDSRIMGLDFMPLVTVSPTFRRLWPPPSVRPVKSKKNVGSSLLRNVGNLSADMARQPIRLSISTAVITSNVACGRTAASYT